MLNLINPLVFNIMKKLFIPIAVIVFLIVAFASCKKIVSSVFGGTDVNVPAVELTIPVIIAVTTNEISLGSIQQHINIDSVIKANTAGIFGINVVSSIKVKEIKFTLGNADALNNLANFKNARVTIQSNTNNAPVDLFSLNFADTYAAAYTFTPASSPELLGYLNGNTIIYTIYGTMRRTTSKTLNMMIAITLRAN